MRIWPNKPGVNPFLLSLSEKLGLPEATVQSGLAAMLGLLKEKISVPDFEEVLGMIPGAQGLAASLPAAPAAGAGLLGGMFGSAGDAIKALSAFQRAGVPTDKIAPLAQGVFDQVRDSGGTELIGKISESIPALKAMLGGR